jgi:hypothetical protein
MMVPGDMDALLDYVRQEHNGLPKENKPPRLNMNKLCIIGADMGAIVALNTASQDWNQHRPERVGKWQLGHFTKALVLLSPESTSHGLTTKAALQNPGVRDTISFLVLVGKNGSKQLQDARRIDSIIEKLRPAPDAEKPETKSVYFLTLDTNLQGTKLFEEKSLGIPKVIEQFIERRIINNDQVKTWKWEPLRKDPYVAEKSE